MTDEVHALCWQHPQTRQYWFIQTAPVEGRAWHGPYPMYQHMVVAAAKKFKLPPGRYHEITFTQTKLGPEAHCGPETGAY